MTRLVPDGPAAGAGLRKGDIVVAVDGQPVRSQEDLEKTIRRMSSGSLAHVRVRRAGAEPELSVTLAKRPGDN